jgi:hypothetical protein
LAGRRPLRVVDSHDLGGLVCAGVMSTACQVGRRLMRSGWIWNSWPRRREPRPLGPESNRPSSVCSVETQTGLVPATWAISSADSGTFWRCAIRVCTLARTCSRSAPSPAPLRSASSCVPRIRLMPAERARPKSRLTCPAASGELVDHHDRGDRGALHPRDERDEVHDDRPGEHRAQQEAAVCVQAEVDDRGGRERAALV